MSYTNGLDKPSDYFNTLLWTGDGTSSRSLTGTGFQPDWTWIKRRSDAQAHSLTDSVRGVTKSLRSDTDAAEDTNNANGYVTSFDSDGFTVAKGSDPSRTNTSGATYVGWNWLAGGTASSNTDGSITSQVSASTTSGFSIVTYTGTGSNATIGHSLNSAPEAIILKGRDLTGRDWRCFFNPLGNTKFISLEQTSAATTSSNTWNNTSPTSSVFSIGTNTDVNNSGEDYLAYCFHSVKGYSKFGSYTGNGNANGTFIYTGFKPAMVIIKRTDSAESWQISDNKRDTYNVVSKGLFPNGSFAESSSSSYYIDYLSNGFKLRNTATWFNASGGTYIYMCFAENPFTTSTGVPTTAR